MRKTKIIMAVALVLMVPLYGIFNLISNEGLRSDLMQYDDSFEKNYQWGFVVKTIQLSNAERGEGILNADQTIAMSLDRRREVVHSVKEARAVLERLKDKPGLSVMIPIGIRMQMDATSRAKSQAEKD